MTTIGVYLIPIIILLVIIEMIIIGRTMIITKLDCSVSTILKMFILIPVLIVLMFTELVLYAINIGGD